MATNINTRNREKQQLANVDQLLQSRLKEYPGMKLPESKNDPFETTGRGSDNIVTQPLENNQESKNHILPRPANQQSVHGPTLTLGHSHLRGDIDSETSLNREAEAKVDPHNEMDKYLKPSEYLKYNVLPPMEDIYLIDYNLSLDLRNDGISNDNHIPDYCFQFSRFGNISRVELVSIIVSPHHSLVNEPYLFVNFKEINGRCHLSNGTRTFGKILFMANREGSLVYVPEECFQTFSRPIYLDNLTLNFCDSSGIPINIKEIKIARVLKSKSKDDLNIESHHQHYLKEGEKIEVQIIKSVEIESYEVEVKEIIDDKTFKIKNDFQQITKQMRIFKTKIDLSLTLKFSEINWFLLNDNNVATSNIIKLSELIKAKNKENQGGSNKPL